MLKYVFKFKSKISNSLRCFWRITIFSILAGIMGIQQVAQLIDGLLKGPFSPDRQVICNYLTKLFLFITDWNHRLTSANLADVPKSRHTSPDSVLVIITFGPLAAPVRVNQRKKITICFLQVCLVTSNFFSQHEDTPRTSSDSKSILLLLSKRGMWGFFCSEV